VSNSEHELFIGQRFLVLLPDDIKKDGNAVLSILLEHIRAVKSMEHGAARARRLCIQIDGGSENWNYFLFGLCQILIESQW
jgi:hypothetical protein